jgi:hypothetical protein
MEGREHFWVVDETPYEDEDAGNRRTQNNARPAMTCGKR